MMGKDRESWDVYNESGSASREAYKLAHQMASKDAMRWKYDLEKAQEEIERLREIEREWLMMWATLEELNLVGDVRYNMALHGWGEEE
jgi:hypothetical protein